MMGGGHSLNCNMLASIVLTVLVSYLTRVRSQFGDPFANNEYVYDDAGPTPFLPNGGSDYVYEYKNDVTCEERSSCQESGYLFLSEDQKNCFCDGMCQIYEDCCPDFAPTEDERRLAAFKLARGLYSCKQVPGINNDERNNMAALTSNNAVYAVDSCPKGYSDRYVKPLCERGSRTDMFSNIPVSSQESGILYQNYFCAVCNNAMNVSFWDIDIGCDTRPDIDLESLDFAVEDSLEDLLSSRNNDCDLAFTHMTHKARFCREEVINKCHDDWKDKRVKRKCKSEMGTSHRYAFQKVFKNEFCAQCNFVNVTYLSCEDESRPVRIPIGPLPPFSILLNINLGYGTVTRREDNGYGTEDVMSEVELKQCQEDHVYDPFAKICRLVSCRPGFDYNNGECIEEIFHTPYMRIPETLPAITPNFEDMEVLDRSEPASGTESVTRSQDEAPLTPKMSGSATGQGSGDYEIKYLECPFITLNAKDYEMDHKGAVYIPLYQQRYDSKEYRNLTDGSIIICNPHNEQNYTLNSTVSATNTMKMFDFDRIQGLVSYIGLLISIICLFIVFVIYMMYPVLRNIPGKCIVCLVISLLMAQLSFLVGGPLTPYYISCFVFGVLLHYFYLTAFCWMNSLSIDIFRTVSSDNNMNHDDTSRRFIIFSLYSWITPAIIVGVSLVLEFFFNQDAFMPMYGKGLCWITQRWPLVIFFAAPVAVILIINLILFILTTAKICLVSRQASRYGHTESSDKHRFLLYIKLCLIMGLTWIFGFVAAVTKLTYLWYVFIILNTLHGAYIFFAFICTRNVLKLLTGKGKKNKPSPAGEVDYYASNGSSQKTKYSVLDTNYNGDAKVIESRETSI